jgi:PAS domain S-box-containing protein
MEPGKPADIARNDPSEIWLLPQSRQVLDAMADMFVALNREYVIVFTNKALSELISERRGDLVGKGVWDLWPEMRESIVEESFARAFATGIPIQFEYCYPASNVWIDVNAVPSGDYLHIYFRDVTAKKRAEQERDLKEDELRALVDSIPQIAWAADPNESPTYFNRRWYEYSGTGPDDPYETGFGVHPDDLIVLQERSQASGGAFEAEARLKRHDGEYRWHLVRVEPRRAGNGEILGFFGTSTDIHDLKIAETRLRFMLDLDDATRLLEDASQFMTVASRMLGQHLKVNRCLYSEVDLDGHNFTVQGDYTNGVASLVGTFPPGAFAESFFDKLKRGITAVFSDLDEDFSDPGPRARFRAVQAEAVIAAPLMKGGTISGIMSVHNSKPRKWTKDEIELVETVANRCWPAIDRVRAARQIRIGIERYKALSEAAASVVFTADPGGNLTEIPLLRDVEPEVASTGLGGGWIDAIHPDDRAGAMQAWMDAVTSEQPYETEFRIRMIGGEYRWHVARGVRVEDSDGKTLEWVGACVDIHEQRRLYDRLRELNEELEIKVRERTADLEAANMEMEGFNYTIAHDLRAPLRAIMSTSRIVIEEAGPALTNELRGLLDRQTVNIKYLSQLLDDLLTYSRLAREPVRRERIDLTALAREVAESVTEERGNPVAVEEGLATDADPSLLRLVLQNLIDNAGKFSSGQGQIEVGSAETSQGAAFFVRDYGVGFKMEQAKKLFQPFERLVRQDEFPGTGIGLANVKRIVQRHGGSVWAEGKPDEGATFFFKLSPE